MSASIDRAALKARAVQRKERQVRQLMSGTRMGKTIEGTTFEILKLKKKGPPSADGNAAADGTMDDPFSYIAANPSRANQDASPDVLSCA